ncbi:hypothetical protein SPOG_01638 [Schizosaccharomyces cryophilus OY26]|uniref:Uncharacterized protein n=1 Tax=Schizosaccharomyces cryophilus (strain OY26 / ATCC MYA-4695 / CBS 11777 / NBRC 106824 / NRRL Y48691) TaxID=653667 RepID=S9W2M5_SCHCR|nr:uncharacterized protein SPOG_01638 [Schizosaccharomyces cryophilus OY26]EPY52310.1 hypothetical protein SPOG_01638 [Schizosaccharomyces cryophilus OY26]
MRFSIFVITLVYFSLGWAAPYGNFSREINNTNVKIANYPFYVQKFPFSPNCSGDVSFIINSPPVNGKGIILETRRASSILTVPADNSSVTCVNFENKKETCYSGDSPKCFNVPQFEKEVVVVMRDSSRPVEDLSTTAFDDYYMITPNMTYAYLNSSTQSYSNTSQLIYKNYLYPCGGNQTCQFDYLSSEIILTTKTSHKFSYSIKEKIYAAEADYLDDLNSQLNANTRLSTLTYKSPKLKSIPNAKAIKQTKVGARSSSSSIKANSFLYKTLAFGLSLLIIFT